MNPKRSWRRRLAWAAGTLAVLAAFAAWFVYAVARPRLGSQNALHGLAAPAGLDWNDPPAVDSLLAVLADAFAARPANAGIVIGVTRNGERHVVARGVLSLEEPTRPIDDSTLFEIGSVTKAFTGVALARAVTDGRVALDQPLGALLPDSMAFPEAVASLPIEALATHTAGLPRDPPSLSLVARLFGANPLGRVADRQAFASLAGLEVPEPPEREYRYSNFGYMLLGRLLEEAGGGPYARLVEDGIAGTLGMRHTWVEPPDAELPRLAVGHRVGRAVEHWYGIPMPGASAVVSTVPDLLTFLEAHLQPDSTALAGVVRLAMTPRLRFSETTETGLGWNIYAVPDAPRIVYLHGSTMGFRSYVGMAPELGLGIVVLANSRDITLADIGRLIMRTLTGNGRT